MRSPSLSSVQRWPPPWRSQGSRRNKSDRRDPSSKFKIGIITSLTGNVAAFGQAHKNGYSIALE